jgi:hypothetical protein
VHATGAVGSAACPSGSRCSCPAAARHVPPNGSTLVIRMSAGADREAVMACDAQHWADRGSGHGCVPGHPLRGVRAVAVVRVRWAPNPAPPPSTHTYIAKAPCFSGNAHGITIVSDVESLSDGLVPVARVGAARRLHCTCDATGLLCVHSLCRGYLIRQGDTTFPDVMRVFFALTLCSVSIGNNLSAMADRAKAVVRDTDCSG